MVNAIFPPLLSVIQTVQSWITLFDWNAKGFKIISSCFFFYILTFPFIFIPLKRPRKVVVKYEDENGDLKEANLDGMMSRAFQHEYDHILGRNFTEKASKLKLERAFKKAGKKMQEYQRG